MLERKKQLIVCVSGQKSNPCCFMSNSDRHMECSVGFEK